MRIVADHLPTDGEPDTAPKDDRQFRRKLHWVISRRSDWSGTDKVILHSLALHMGGLGDSPTVGHFRLIEECSLSKSTYYRKRAELERAGILKTMAFPGLGKRTKVNLEFPPDDIKALRSIWRMKGEWMSRIIIDPELKFKWERVIRDLPLTTPEKATAYGLANLNRKDGIPFRWTTIEEVGQLAGYGTTYTRGKIESLESQGLIRVERKDGRGILIFLTKLESELHNGLDWDQFSSPYNRKHGGYGKEPYHSSWGSSF